MDPLTVDQRELRLYHAAQKYTAGKFPSWKYEVRSQTPTMMVLVPKWRRWLFFVDLLLVLLTLGLWLFMVLIEWACGLYSTLRLSVDVTGTVHVAGRSPLMRLADNASVWADKASAWAEKASRAAKS